jgi:hypothetical protein
MKKQLITVTIAVVALTLAQAAKNDCVIVATEAYKRLRAQGVWAEVVSFRIKCPDRKEYGHAVCIYQISKADNLCLYDAWGTTELDAKSADLREIERAFNQKITKGYTVSNFKVLAQEPVKARAANEPPSSDEGNDWGSNVTQGKGQIELPEAVEEDDDEETEPEASPALIWRILGGLIMVGVGIFFIGFALQALFWIIGILFWILTLVLSGCGWVWEKLARTVKEEQVLELRTITALPDDPVERALERVRRNNQ